MAQQKQIQLGTTRLWVQSLAQKLLQAQPINKYKNRSSRHGAAETNPTRNPEVAGSIPGLTQWVKRSGIAVSCGVGCKHGSALALLWLWPRPAATALI